MICDEDHLAKPVLGQVHASFQGGCFKKCYSCCVDRLLKTVGSLSSKAQNH